MKKINKLLYFADNEEEINSDMQDNMDNYVDVITYLKILNNSNSIKLFQLIVSKLEFLDSKNILLNYIEIKNRLGIKSKYVEKLEKDNTSVNNAALSLTEDEAEQICFQLHNELLSLISNLYGEIKY